MKDSELSRLPSDLQLYTLSSDRGAHVPYRPITDHEKYASSTVARLLQTASVRPGEPRLAPPAFSEQDYEAMNSRTWTPGELHRLRRNSAVKAAAVASVAFEEDAARLALGHPSPMAKSLYSPNLAADDEKRVGSRMELYMHALDQSEPSIKVTGADMSSPHTNGHQDESKGFTPRGSRNDDSKTASNEVDEQETDDSVPTKRVVLGIKDPALVAAANASSSNLPDKPKAKEEGQKIEMPDVDPEIMETNVREGLSSDKAAERILKYGYNELTEKKTNPILKFLSYFTGSIAYLIEAACILSAVLGDWTDFGIILALLLVNAFIGFIEEARAESAVEALRNTLALKTKVIRNGHMEEVLAREIVPGDIISLRIGDIVAADCKLLGLNSNFEETRQEMSIDQSALTGESLPVTKVKGDACWSGTIVKQGQNLAIVTHTGEKTFLGRAAHLIAITEDSGHFQQVITRIGNFIIVITLTMVVIILIVAVVKGENFLKQLDYALVLTIASIPVGLPTVLSVTMAVGAKQLAAKQVIVKRLTAVEEMAGLRILCSDKTGTLTLNQLSVDDPYLSPGCRNEDLLLASFLASEPGANDAIELCVRTEALAKVPELKGVTLHTAMIPNYRCVQFQPFDPVSKLTRAVIHKLDTDEIFCVAKGAPQVILKLCKNSSIEAEQAIVKMARRGFRALGVARSKSLPHKPGEEFSPTQDLVEWQLVGLLSLLDPPRPDSGHTIKECNKFGLDVKMITGDAVLIAKEVAKRLGMNRNILHPSKLQGDNEAEIIAHCVRADGFAQVVPEDKFRVVELLQKEGHLVGMTGDGVNDAPALKKANVGIAVHGCTDAARSAADIVLLQPGLSTIVDGIITSRQIFQRMRSYAVYRITSTVHFMVFMFFAILCLNWSLPPDLIVLITLLNDAATIVISVDNAKISKKPDKWRLGQMLTLSVVLGLLLTASSFAHWFIANNVFQVERSQLDTILYLQMSSCPHFVIFSTRLSVPFYKNPPSLIFFVAVAGTQVFAMFISIYGVLAAPIGWGWGVSIMCISIGYFIVLDFVKCQIYRVWSFELTACLWPSKERRDKLARYRALAAKRARFSSNVSKMRRVVTMVRVAKNWGDGSHYHNLPEAELAVVPSGHH